MALDQAEQTAIEVQRRIAALGGDGEVVHADDHGASVLSPVSPASQAINTNAPTVARDSSRACACAAASSAWRSIGGALMVPSASACHSASARAASACRVAM